LISLLDLSSLDLSSLDLFVSLIAIQTHDDHFVCFLPSDHLLRFIGFLVYVSFENKWAVWTSRVIVGASSSPFLFPFLLFPLFSN